MSKSRLIAFDISPIPFSEIACYADKYEVDDFDKFVFAIQVLDQVFLDFYRSKNQSKAEAKNSGKAK